MTTWREFETEASDLAAAVRARLDAHRHHVIATLRRDGSPRVSGTEVAIVGDVLTLGSMPGARKADDLRRDPRYSLHTNPGHHTMDGGDVKLSGRAREVHSDEKTTVTDTWPEGIDEGDAFVLDLDEVVHVTVDGGSLHVDRWSPGNGVRRTTRT
ncbi:pyridoxamine 5'-phosphate oxidase family protein [Rhodococcus rhodnii]|uniref:Pyridoxamine 5'-phosphate oxidase N-terminal domain-containing protein n=2 Tax=Rhodococcus rhodnii TaxID=38312 RepID=R7WPC0_9NOCA|nr:pyridoxamine 5'-phosphate oxidase family protein [Rhodococcus rhodnii]EOM77130.1 hypothetical protein Rrhod_1500 [Rhodococcus rhodnii LMG 5362]TXG92123.1 pyridoxamine 5'-phosphate oxidase family protein [Rhodococcus rhodnii]